jgi:hypothetical protein
MKRISMKAQDAMKSPGQRAAQDKHRKNIRCSEESNQRADPVNRAMKVVQTQSRVPERVAPGGIVLKVGQADAMKSPLTKERLQEK